MRRVQHAIKQPGARLRAVVAATGASLQRSGLGFERLQARLTVQQALNGLLRAIGQAGLQLVPGRAERSTPVKVPDLLQVPRRLTARLVLLPRPAGVDCVS